MRSLVVILILFAATLFAQDAFQWNLPQRFPRPIVPADNEMSTAKVELGRRMFYDTRMSVNGKQSCASCHRQELAFTDGRARAEGATGELHPRGSMSLANVAYSPLRNIAVTAPYMHDGSVATLEEAIEHYAAGGLTIASGPHTGIGRDNPNKASNIQGFVLTPSEKQDLIAFLRSLTDRDFLTNPRFSDPWTRR